MNLPQRSRFKMFQAVSTFLKTQADKWSGNAVVAEQVNHFNLCFLMVSTLVGLQGQGKNKGYTATINDNANAMAALAFSLSKQLLSYARKTNNLVMIEEVGYISLAQLKAGSRAVMVERCNAIAKVATDNLAKLSDYLVTEDVVNTLQQAIAVTTASEDTRNVTARKGSSATQSLRENINNTKQSLADLDLLIEAQINDEAFVTAYNALRLVVEYHGGYAKKEITETPAAANPTEQHDNLKVA